MIGKIFFIATISVCLQANADEDSSEHMPVEGCAVSKSYDSVFKETSYECTIEKCRISVDVGGRGEEHILTGYSDGNACRSVSFSKKIAGWSFLLAAVKEDGRLDGPKRVGPGPGDMCKGKLRERLIKVTSYLLSDDKFVKKNPGKVDLKYMYIKDFPLLWKEAGVFDEYFDMFRSVGYELALSDYEGIVFDKVSKDEILRQEPSSRIKQLRIPCDGMLYFSKRKIIK